MLLVLSHAVEETAAARRLARQLEGVDCIVWLAVDGAKPGERRTATWPTAIEQADAFAVYVGRSGAQHWVDGDTRLALLRQAADPEFRLLPILGPGCRVEDLPPFFARHPALDLGSGFGQGDLDRRIRSIFDTAPMTGPPLATRSPPYKGILPFGIDDAHLFFGRDQEVQQLLDHLCSRAFFAVSGDAGSGKTSLVRAGLVPAFHHGRLAVGSSSDTPWNVAVLHPGRDPFAALNQALLDLDPGLPMAARIRARTEIARRLEEGRLDDLVALVPAGRPTLLVVDAFEELYTLTADAERRRLWIEALLSAGSASRRSAVHVLILLRTDFLAACEQHSELARRLEVNMYRLGPMSPPDLRMAIERPLVLAGAQLQDGLSKTLIDDLGGVAGRLPRLECALLELWEQRSGQTLTRKTYEAIGRLSGAIKKRADRVDQGLGERHRHLVRKMALRLIQPGDGSVDTRRPARKREILALGQHRSEVDEVLRKLMQAGLVSLEEGSRDADSEESILELSHEVLLSDWPLLRQGLDSSRDALRMERRIVAAARRWASCGRDPSLLYQGAELADAEQWSGHGLADLPFVAKDFLEAGIRARQREAASLDRQRRRLLRAAANARRRVAILLACGALILLAVLGAGIHRSRDLAAQRESGALVARAQHQLENRPMDSLKLAIQAARRWQGPAVEDTLRRAMHHLSRDRQVRLDPGEEVRHAVFSADGTTALTAGGHWIRLWETRFGAELARLKHRSWQPRAVFGADGDTVLVSGSQVLLWWPASGEIRTLLQSDAFIHAAFSPDGKRLVTAVDGDDKAQLWDTRSGQEVAVLKRRFSLQRVRALPPPASRLESCHDVHQQLQALDGQIGPLQQRVDHLTELLARLDDLDLEVGEQNIIDLRRADDDLHQQQIARDLLAARLENCQRDQEPERQPSELPPDQDLKLTAVSFGPEGRFVAASSRRTVWLWDTRLGIDSALRGHRDDVLDVLFAPDGETVLSTSEDGTARLWAMASGELRATLYGHRERVALALFSPDGKSILTTDVGATARLWDARTGRSQAMLDQPVSHAAFSPAGGRLLTIDSRGPMRIWETKSWTQIHTVEILAGRIDHAAFSADERILTIDEYTHVRISNARLHPEFIEFQGHTAPISHVAFDSDGRRILSAGHDATARIWDAASGRQLAVFRGHEEAVLRADLSPQGHRVATASADRTVRIWDARFGHQVAVIRDSDEVTGLDFSPDGRTLLTTTDGNARLWDLSGEQLAAFEHYEALLALFSPDGREIFTTDRWTTRRWHASGQALPLADGAMVCPFDTHRMLIRRSPSDFTRFFEVWDETSQETLAVLRQTDSTTEMLKDFLTIDPGSVEFSSDCRKLILLEEERVDLWDLEAGRRIARIRGHAGRMTGAAFSPAGDRVITAGEDAISRIWDVETGEELSVLGGHHGRVDHAIFSPDGGRVLTADRAGTLRVFVADFDDLLALAAARVRLFRPIEENLVSRSVSFHRDKASVALPETELRYEIPRLAAYISVTADGQIRVTAGDGPSTPIPVDDVAHLAAHLAIEHPRRPIVIKADKTVPYRQVAKILEVSQRAKIERLYFLSRPKAVERTGDSRARSPFVATRGLELALAAVNARPPIGETRDPVRIDIQQDGRILVDRQPVTLDEILDHLGPKLRSDPGRPTILQPHPEAPYGSMVAVFDVLRQGRETLGLDEDIDVSVATLSNRAESGADARLAPARSP